MRQQQIYEPQRGVARLRLEMSTKVPRQHQHEVRIPSYHILLIDDANARPRCVTTELVRVDLPDAAQKCGGDSTVLQNHIALGRSAEAHHRLMRSRSSFEEVAQFLARLLHPARE